MSHQGLAYLFERFPSFTQTFCFREVLALKQQGLDIPVFSIRKPDDEPDQDFPSELREAVTYLPGSFDEALEESAFRKQARRGIAMMQRLWGGDSEKRRIYEALWLIPRLRAAGIGHVHVHFAGIAARTAFWLNRLDGVQYSFTAHANDIFCDEPAERLGMLIADADFVVTVSDYSAGYLRNLFPFCTTKLHRVYNGIHMDRFRLSEHRRDRPLILSVGRYIEKKGFSDLIDACAGLGSVPFECKIVGQGPLEEGLKQQVAALGLGERVQITGPKPEREVAELLAGTSVFALPCVNATDGGRDNLPTVIMEAMAAGVPVVSTKVAGIPEMVIDGRTGYLVPEKRADALARRLNDLLGDHSLTRRLGHAGRDLCRERFATEVTTGQLARLFETTGALHAKPRPWWRGIFGF